VAGDGVIGGVRMRGERSVMTAARRGIGPWIEFGEVEDQLRTFKPLAVRKFVASGMVPFYAMLAHEHGYRAEARCSCDSSVRMVLVRHS